MPYVRFLDGLRCVSILWVILIHLKFHGDRAYQFVAGHGWMGVDMFFVISGFLITSILLREHRATGTISLRRFYIRRILRIWPAYYALIAMSLSLALLGVGYHPALALRTIKWPAMFLTNAYAGFRRTESCVDLHTWSLALEEQFYLIWPFLLFLSVKGARRIATAAIIGIGLWRTWLAFHIAPGVEAMRRLFYAPDTRMDVILFGAILAFILLDEQRVSRIRAFLNSSLVPIIFAVGFAGTIYINNRWSGHVGNGIGYSVSAFTMAFGIAYLYTVRPAWALRVLEWKPIVYVGRISYGMYLFHGLVIAALQAIFGRPASVSAEFAFAVGVYVGTVLVAAVSYRYFESSFLSLKQRFSVLTSTYPQADQPASIELAV